MNIVRQVSLLIFFLLVVQSLFSQEINDTLSIEIENDTAEAVINQEGDLTVQQVLPNQELKDPDTNVIITVLRGLLGLGVLVLIGYLFSTNRKAISWRVVFIGFAFQI
ncbi:MAG: hypothetical protein O6939_07870, partial [Bacteroidetes bacterium]|nr:hypothetical protein [Bacteroidota bacterium]